jgi:hypothetical protein
MNALNLCVFSSDGVFGRHSEGSLWGRFLEYARTGHGGNVELRRRGSKGYQVTVLEVVNSDTGIERVEEAWKQKLISRKFGLNKN